MPSSDRIEVHTESALYRNALGPLWDLLAPAVRAAHATTGAIAAKGQLSVTGGRGLVAGILGSLLRLPPCSENAIAELAITEDLVGESWTRTISGHRITTHQRFYSEFEIVETIGVLAFRLRLAVNEAAGLSYRTVGACVVLGRLTVPLPACVRPTISADENPLDSSGEGSTHISVNVALPVVGALFGYSGAVARESSP